MAALTKKRTTKAKHGASSTTRSHEIVDTKKVFPGSLIALDTGTGQIQPWTGVATDIFAGYLDDDDDNGAEFILGTAVDPRPRGLCREGDVLTDVPVTGASAITDVGKDVFATNDNPDDITLTDPTTSKPIGVIVRFNSATSFEVQLKTLIEYTIST